VPHVPILRNDFSSRASNKTFKSQLPELNMINGLSLETNSGDNLWRMWSNGYDVRLWSVQRGFDSLLSPLNEERGRKVSQTESLSLLSPSKRKNCPSLLELSPFIQSLSNNIEFLTDMERNVKFDSIGGLRLVSPFGQLNDFGGISWKQ
jgi:hypothetical protein